MKTVKRRDTVTRSELIKRLAKKHDNLYLKHIERLVDIVFSEITQTLAENGRAELRGFGAFSVRERKSRNARNPKTNEVVNLEERHVPYFRAGKDLKARLNADDNTAQNEDNTSAQTA